MTLGTLDDALCMARQGVRVFPIRVTPSTTSPGKWDKAPLTEHGHLDGTCDEETIRKWGASAWGAVAEKFVAMDIDSHEAWAECRRRGVERTPMLRTMREEGRHLYYRHFPNAWSGAGVIPGVDIRGGGTGWVVLYGHWNLSEMAEAPAWFREARGAPGKPGQCQTFSPTADGKIPHGQHYQYIKSLSSSLAKRIAGVTEASLLTMVRANCLIALDDTGDHEEEITVLVRSAILKYGSAPEPASPTTQPPAPPVAPAAPESSLPDPFPRELFRENPDTGKTVPDPHAFAQWFRESERFAITIERESFASSQRFEILHYEKERGYYNGTARAFIQGRVEDAHRSRGLMSSSTFRNEIMAAIGATSEFHRRRDTYNPPNMLCLRNGILNLDSLTISPFTPDIVFTSHLPVDFDPAATCPTFDRYLEDVVPDPARRLLIVDLLGYCLSNSNPFQVFFTLVGDGHNGKTTFLNLITDLLGEESTAAETLQHLSHNRFVGAQLEGKLVNLCDDLPHDQLLRATGVLKMLTGEGTIPIERKFQAPGKMRWGGKLVNAANRTPPVQDDTFAFWRRCVVFLFDVIVPMEKRDPKLRSKLQAELPGILNRAIEGLRRCQSRNSFDPEHVLEGGKELWQKRADPTKRFFSEVLEKRANSEIESRELFVRYTDWCEDEGCEPLKKETLAKKLLGAFPSSEGARKRHGTKVVSVYTNIAFREVLNTDSDRSGPARGSPDRAGVGTPGSPDLDTYGSANSENVKLEPRAEGPTPRGVSTTLSEGSCYGRAGYEVSLHSKEDGEILRESEHQPRTPRSTVSSGTQYSTASEPQIASVSGQKENSVSSETGEVAPCYDVSEKVLAYSRLKEWVKARVRDPDWTIDPESVRIELEAHYEPGLVREVMALATDAHHGAIGYVLEGGRSLWKVPPGKWRGS